MSEEAGGARCAIMQALAVCTQAGDARKADAYAGSYTEDGVLDLGERIEGREAIRQWMARPSVIPAPHDGRPAFVSHHLTTCRIDLTSERSATARTYWLVISAVGLDHSGYYDDRFLKVDDAWLIAYRRPRTLWISPESLLKRAERK